jgi:hypothetical protein
MAGNVATLWEGVKSLLHLSGKLGQISRAENPLLTTFKWKVQTIKWSKKVSKLAEA